MQRKFVVRLTKLESASRTCNFSHVFRKNIVGIVGSIHSLYNILSGIARVGQTLFAPRLFTFGFMVYNGTCQCTIEGWKVMAS